MILRETVDYFGRNVSQRYKKDSYCSFAPAEETEGFIDTSATQDGSRGIAFLCDRIRVDLDGEIQQIYYTRISEVSIIYSFESAFCDELLIKGDRTIRISDYSLNKPFLKQLIDTLCRQYKNMNEGEREQEYADCTTDAAAHFAQENIPAEKPKEMRPTIEITEEKIEWISGKRRMAPLIDPTEDVSVQEITEETALLEDMTREQTMSYLLDSISEINDDGGAIALEERVETEIPVAKEVAPTETEVPVAQEVAPTETEVTVAQEVAPTETEVPVVQEVAPTKTEVPVVQEVAPTETEVPVAQEVAPAETEVPVAQEVAPTETEIPVAQEVAPTETEVPVAQEVAPTETEIPVAQENAPTETVIPVTQAQPTPAEITPVAETTYVSPFTQEPDIDDIYIKASRKLREFCEDGRLEHTQLETAVKEQLIGAAEVFMQVTANEADMPQALLPKITELKSASDSIDKYFALGEDIAARVMFFMLYQMLSYADRIVEDPQTKQRLNDFFRRYGPAGITLSMLDTRI